MGLVLSTSTHVAPISLASTTIGFVSFTFTLATLLRVFWDNFQTMSNAPTEIEDALTNLRQGLYEERLSLRKALRHGRRRRSRSARGSRGESDEKHGVMLHESRSLEPETEMALRAMSRAVKNLLKRFQKLEQPFLAIPDPPRRRRPSLERRGEEAYMGGYASGDVFDEAGETDSYYPEYKECGLVQRYRWIKSKTAATQLIEALSRITIRRMSIQLHHMSRSVPSWTDYTGHPY